MAAALLERGHTVWEDQALPIVFLGAANDHGCSKPKIRKGADCYPLSEIVPLEGGNWSTVTCCTSGGLNWSHEAKIPVNF